MFDLNVVDHVRLNLTRTGENYTVHARAAERLARMTAWTRIGVLILLVAAAGSSVVSLIEGQRPFQIAAVIAASLAFAGYAVYVGWGFEGRVAAHRLCARNLWLVCERYRSLLTEIRDGCSIAMRSSGAATSSRSKPITPTAWHSRSTSWRMKA